MLSPNAASADSAACATAAAVTLCRATHNGKDLSKYPKPPLLLNACAEESAVVSACDGLRADACWAATREAMA